MISTGWDTFPAQSRPALGSAAQQLLGEERSLPFFVRLPGLRPDPADAAAHFDLRLTDAEGGCAASDSSLASQLTAARRLVEAGTRFVTVVDPGWDTHADTFPRLSGELLPRLDRGLHRLLDDLEDRGLLETTLVMVLGEFSRTPRINPDAGRDHWPHVQSVFLAGGGIPGGTVIGASDTEGAYPSEQPVHARDLAATLYHKLGIELDAQVTTASGLRVPLLPEGARPVHELL